MKKIERIVFVIMVVSFLAETSMSFIHGLNDGLLGDKSVFTPNILLHNIWSISTLVYIIIRGIRYKFK